jgi:formylglycine-generating enzyme required for sulfatase activity
MAGNVSEWTATAGGPDGKLRILKGGNFSIPLQPLHVKTPAPRDTAQEYIGFRTISHTPPPSK